MKDFTTVLSDARQLPETERLRLIEALWDTVSPKSEASISDAWAIEIERRVADLLAGTAKTVPWSRIREEALARG